MRGNSVWGVWALGKRQDLPLCWEEKIAFEFKFTVKLKLEFDFDFDLISGSNFNKMGVKVVQISTYHFQI